MLTENGIRLAQYVDPGLDNDCPVSSPFCNTAQYFKNEYANQISAIGDLIHLFSKVILGVHHFLACQIARQPQTVDFQSKGKLYDPVEILRKLIFQ
jgi:hypothetical protein